MILQPWEFGRAPTPYPRQENVERRIWGSVSAEGQPNRAGVRVVLKHQGKEYAVIRQVTPAMVRALTYKLPEGFTAEVEPE